jgi:molecular chaperone GrpE
VIPEQHPAMSQEETDPATTAAPGAAAPAESNARVAELEQRCGELEAKCAELEARWLRSQADHQNARRRAQQELDSALLHRLQPLLDELLLVADYLDMALASPQTSAEAKALAMGVTLTRQKLTQALEAIDVRPIETKGVFDPARHEAGESRASAEHAPGTILATGRTGYTWQGRILRPARVVVACAPAPSPET